MNMINNTLHNLFEEQVRNFPTDIALTHGDMHITYNELNQKANQLARKIRAEYCKRMKAQIVADVLIAICMDKSVEMIISILAILKAGGAYVPIDPSYPYERIQHILDDTQTALILTKKMF